MSGQLETSQRTHRQLRIARADRGTNAPVGRVEALDAVEHSEAADPAAPAPSPRSWPPDGEALSSAALKRRLIVADAAAFFVGVAAAFGVQAVFRPVPSGILIAQLELVLLSLPGFIFGAVANRLLVARANERPGEEVANIVKTVAVGTMAMLSVAFVMQFKELSRLWLVLVAVCVTGALVIERRWARRVFTRLRSEGRVRRRIIIVGTDAHAIGLLHTYQRDLSLGYEVVGFVGDDDLGTRGGVRVLGSSDQLLELLERHEAVGVVVSLPSVSQESVNTIARELTDQGYHVALSSALRDIAVSRLRPQQLDGRTMIYVEPVIRDGWRAMAKRTFDVCFASLLLVLTSPILLLSIAALKLDSRGPVFFRQMRVGRDGEPIWVVKLRTMVVDAHDRRDEIEHLNEADGPLFKIKDDPRITRVGRVLRKLSIDELPQLYCVLRGDMSIVGPRPALPDEMAQWDDDVHERLRVLPGLTGLWQVSGRSDSSFDDYKRLDLYYVDNWSLAHDVAICARTVGVVLFARGAS
ncbi:MAG: sugar transferase [Actinomycetota bacterium]